MVWGCVFCEVGAGDVEMFALVLSNAKYPLMFECWYWIYDDFNDLIVCDKNLT